MSNHLNALRSLQLRVSANLIDATEEFNESPSLDTLNSLRVAEANKSLFDRMVSKSSNANSTTNNNQDKKNTESDT